MPRLLANEFVYAAATSSATDEHRYSEYNVTPTKSPSPPPLHHYKSQRQNRIKTVVSSRNRFSKSRSRSPPVHRPRRREVAYIPQNKTAQPLNAVAINDDDDVPSPSGMLSDDDEEDFKGFDDNDTPNTSDSPLKKSHAKETKDPTQHKKSILKRNSQAYHEDSEGVVEAIEVDDDEDIEEVDGKILLKSKHYPHRTSTQSGSKSLHNSHTPSKRKKQQNVENKMKVTISPTHENQIVEINSDSTTISQKQKRHQINSKFQRHINRQTKNATIVANKCSTESTSEFPVSSPSNPQQPRDGGGKYPPRPPLLKNTLPGDSFERQLALITASNPQLSLSEKIQSWCCDDDFSDVEDVQIFDEEFKRLDEKRKKELKLSKNKKVDDEIQQHYDFSEFKQKLLDNMKIQNYQRFYCGSDGSLMGAGFKDKRSTASDSSKSGKFHDDRPSTSAIAQQLHLRRLKLSNLCSNANFDEGKKRFTKDLSKRNQNSTTPPATSSSENDRDYFAKNNIGTRTTTSTAAAVPNKNQSQAIQVHEKLLCPSSSDDANSLEVPPSIQEKKKNGNIKNVSQENPVSKNLQRLDAGEMDSVFRLHRLNREIDKQIEDLKKLEYKKPSVYPRKAKEVVSPLIDEDNKKNEQTEYSIRDHDDHDFFKTPIIPPKYLGNVSTSKDSSSPNQHNAKVSTGKITPPSGKETNAKLKLENDANDANDSDFDGVYHQQHEFCNYLGLTGMSTATAMANAVAELAQCNLTRRSMRVLRQQQQQDRKEKSASKDDSKEEVNSVKIKPQKEIKKRRERGGYDAPLESEESMVFNDQGSNSQKSELFVNPLDESNNINLPLTPKISPNLVKSPTVISNTATTATTFGVNKPEPQIKILCHIATSAEKKSNDDIEVIPVTKTPGGNETKQFKQFNNKSKINDIKEEEIVTDIKSDDSNPEEDEERSEELSSPFDDQKKILRFNAERRAKLKQTNLDVYILNNEEGIQRAKDVDIFENLENENHFDLKSKTKLNSEQFKINTIQIKSSPLRQKEMITKDLQMPNAEQHLEENDNNRSLTTTPTSANMIKEKLQAALEESRKTKPSIFIVQSLECVKEKTINKSKSIISHSINNNNNNNNNNNDANKTKEVKAAKSLPSPLKIEIKQHMSDYIPSDNQSDKSINHKQKSNKKLSAKARRKAKKQNITQKRKLRSHKVLYITKTSKSEDTLNKIDDKSLKSHQSKKEGKIKFSKTSLQSMQSFESTVSINSMPLKQTNQFIQLMSGKPSMQSKQSMISLSSEQPSSASTLQDNNIKSFRNAQTETRDLENYNDNNSMARTRLMAKATALLERSRRMSVGRGLSSMTKLKTKILRPSLKLRSSIAKVQNYKPKVNLVYGSNKNVYESASAATSMVDNANDCKLENTKSLFHSTAAKNHKAEKLTTNNLIHQESENVVVSSTTNSFDERPSPHHHHHHHHSHQQRQTLSPITLRSVHSSTPCVVNSKLLKTQDSWTQIENASIESIQYLNSPPSAAHIMRNPLNTNHGMVLYMYYELDVLIVVQEKLVSFWKFSRILSTIAVVEKQQKSTTLSQIQKISHQGLNPKAQFKTENTSHEILHSSSSATPTHIVDISLRQPVLSSSSLDQSLNVNGEWIMLGELKRLTYDFEIHAPYANRICLHNSTPIYVEMRGRPLPKHHRDCNLLSMYINIYFYHDEDIIAKNNSIQLDTIQSDFRSVNYTTLKDSRYFIITWPQENLMGKPRSGLCKYSLTPQLDTLASIREFKSMRHTIKYLECMNDDKLIGFGDSQLTIWDHRSGDVLMNYDFEIPMGKNLGTVYCSSPEFEQNNMVLLFQWRDNKLPNKEPELMVIACTLTHSQPSYRILYRQPLPMAFKNVERAINTGEHIIIIGSELNKNEKEIWISCENPSLMVLVSPSTNQDCKRFYSRGRSQLLELTDKTLNLDTLANHNLNIAAAGMAFNAI